MSMLSSSRRIADPKTLHQKRADLRLVGAQASDIYDIGDFDLGGLDRLAVDQPDQGPQHEIDADNETGGEDGVAPIAGAGQQTASGRTPKRRRGVQAAYIDAFLPNHPGAEKTDAGDDLRGDPCWTGIGALPSENHENRGDQGRLAYWSAIPPDAGATGARSR